MIKRYASVRLRTVSFFGLLFYSLSFVALPASVQAQPPDPNLQRISQNLYTEFKKEIAALNKNDPQTLTKSIAEYRKFLSGNTDLHPVTGVAAWHDLAFNLYFSQAKDAKTAIETAEHAYKKYQAHPASSLLLADVTGMLIQQRRYAEAEVYLKDRWEGAFVGTRLDSMMLLRPYLMALDGQGKHDEFISVAGKILREGPAFLNETTRGNGEWIMRRLVDTLIARNRIDEAISYAKLNFMQCEFNERAINGATTVLAKVWMARDLNNVAAEAFVQAQKDAAAANPLAAVPLPALSEAEVKVADESLGRSESFRTHDQISLYIFTGKFGDAMSAARQLLLDQPNSPAGTLEVCRVFKAADLNLLRANQFLEYVKSGKGSNPVSEFLKQQTSRVAQP